MTSKLTFQSPMLARSYSGDAKSIGYPCFVQPKIDGIRCVTDGQRFWSREGNRFPAANVAHLRVKRFPFLLDGELSLVDGFSDFEEIASVVKRAGHKESGRLCFNAFDVITDEPYGARKNQLAKIFADWQLKIISNRWHRLTTRQVSNALDLIKHHQYFLSCDYEGTMIRSAFGLYTSTRSKDLLKWKPLLDAEFEIVDVKEAKGKDAGTPIFICTTDQHSTFRVRPMGTTKQREKMWRDRKKLIGEMLTVEYQNLTRYGKPRFPRAKVLRNYE